MHPCSKQYCCVGRGQRMMTKHRCTAALCTEQQSSHDAFAENRIAAAAAAAATAEAAAAQRTPPSAASAAAACAREPVVAMSALPGAGWRPVGLVPLLAALLASLLAALLASLLANRLPPTVPAVLLLPGPGLGTGCMPAGEGKVRLKGPPPAPPPCFLELSTARSCARVQPSGRDTCRCGSGGGGESRRMLPTA